MFRTPFQRRQKVDRNDVNSQSLPALPMDPLGMSPHQRVRRAASTSNREALTRYLQIMSDEGERNRLEETVAASRRRSSRSTRSSRRHPENTSNESLDEELLQLSVDGLQDSLALFESIVRANLEKGPPPASEDAIARLPHARVLPSDKASLKHDSSPCTICTERLVDGVAVSRLPCGHVYHINCIVPWLNKTCTCPDCRYELETNDPTFEKGRVKRMEGRPIYRCSCHPSGIHNCFFVKPDAPGSAFVKPTEESMSSVMSDMSSCMLSSPEELDEDYVSCLNRF
jgi:hypothetical protein